MAIKVLHRGSTSEERASLENRFAREVNMMSRVHHDNLVKVSSIVANLSFSTESLAIMLSIAVYFPSCWYN